MTAMNGAALDAAWKSYDSGEPTVELPPLMMDASAVTAAEDGEWDDPADSELSIFGFGQDLTDDHPARWISSRWQRRRDRRRDRTGQPSQATPS
jgi:hypothetical protein